MALKYLTHIDLNKNQLQNAVIHPLGTAPSGPVEGQIYYDSTAGDKKVYIYNVQKIEKNVVERNTFLNSIRGFAGRTVP